MKFFRSHSAPKATSLEKRKKFSVVELGYVICVKGAEVGKTFKFDSIDNRVEFFHNEKSSSESPSTASILIEGDKFYLQSSCPSCVNNEKVKAGKKLQLDDGAQISFSNDAFKFIFILTKGQKTSANSSSTTEPLASSSTTSGGGGKRSTSPEMSPQLLKKTRTDEAVQPASTGGMAKKPTVVKNNDCSSTAAASSSSSSGGIGPDKIADTLECVVCQDVLYKAATVVPCMHNFCGSCISVWVKKNAPDCKCPTCRAQIERVLKNVSLDNLVDVLLQAQPEKQKSAAEMRRLDDLNTITYGKLLRNMFVDDDSDEVSSESSDDSEDDTSNSDESGSSDSDSDSSEDGAGDPYGARDVQNQIIRNADDAFRRHVQDFIAIAQVTRAEAEQLLRGAQQRGFQEYFQHALSYYFEQS